MTNSHIDINTLILGAGMAGLGASIQAKRDNIDSITLELSDTPGGLCRNSTVHGCDFDFGPKVLILDDTENSKDLLSFLGNNVEKYDLVEKTYLQEFGQVGFPIQRHLIDLPKNEREMVLASLKNRDENLNIKSYQDWLISNYGEYLAKKVLIPYEEKKWQLGLDQLDYRWALSRPVKVDIEQVIQGSMRHLPPDRVYYYPKQGNISTLTAAMADKAGKIQYNEKIIHIDLKNSILYTEDNTYRYKQLISTIPLNEFITLSNGLSDAVVRKAPEKLKRLSIRVFNLVYKGNHDLGGSAVYFPEKDFIFRRVSILQNLCPALRRNGLTPISVEVSLNNDNVDMMSEDDQYAQVLEDLSKIEQFAALGSPIDYEVLSIPFAYPIQKDGLREFVQEIQIESEKYSVVHCGRGGNFDYCNSDLAYRQGKDSVHKFTE